MEDIYCCCQQKAQPSGVRLTPAKTPYGSKLTEPYDSAFEEVQRILQAFVSTKAKVAQMYKKNIALALLETSFRIPQALLTNGAGSDRLTPRLTQICLFLDQNFDRLSAFDDLKGYVTELSFQEARYFVEEMIPKLVGDVAAPPISPSSRGYC
jgi:hypothetical protein